MKLIFNYSFSSIALCVLMTAVCPPSAYPQTFSVLHTFTGAADGANPTSGLTMDRGGNLYGTAPGGGTGYGTVFELKQSRGSWIFSPLYSFHGSDDGAFPSAGVTFGPDGSLYGTTQNGGTHNHGTVFRLHPPATFCRSVLCPWTENVLYRFRGALDGGDGSLPNYGDVVFDSTGALYGMTSGGGVQDAGSVYKLTRSGGTWTETVLYSFVNGNDGGLPYGGLALDPAGNLFGTAAQHGSQGFGTVFQLTLSGSQWVERTLYSFQGIDDGGYPAGTPLLDAAGNLFGTTSFAGGLGGGTDFVVSPSGDNWTFSVIQNSPEASVPWAGLTSDAAGNLYGTTVYGGDFDGVCDPQGCGTVYKLSPIVGGYLYTQLYAFTGGADGQSPYGRVLVDAAGNLYGTALLGGFTGQGCFNGCGVVWQIRP